VSDTPAVRVEQQPAGGGGTVTTIAGGLFDAFKTSPVLLLIVILNGVFVASAAYFLLQVEAYRAADRQAIATMLDKCIAQTVPVDYLVRSQLQWQQTPRAP